MTLYHSQTRHHVIKVECSTSIKTRLSCSYRCFVVDWVNIIIGESFQDFEADYLWKVSLKILYSVDYSFSDLLAHQSPRLRVSL